MYLQPYLIISLLLFLATASCPDNCVDCDLESNNCFACVDHYELSVTGSCISDLTVENCALYGPYSLCFLCKPTYELQNGTCVKVYSGCLTYDEQAGQCLACGFGTNLSGGTCKGAINCKLSDGACLNCKEGFLLVDGKCMDSTGNCLEKNQNGLCSICKQNYTLVGYECISSNLTVFGCNIYWENGECINCKNGFEMYQGYCLLQWWIDNIRQGQTTLEEVLHQNNITKFGPLFQTVRVTLTNLTVLAQQNTTIQTEKNNNSSTPSIVLLNQSNDQANDSPSAPNKTNYENSSHSANTIFVSPSQAVANPSSNQSFAVVANSTSPPPTTPSSAQSQSNTATQTSQSQPASSSSPNTTNNSGNHSSPSGVIIISDNYKETPEHSSSETNQIGNKTSINHSLPIPDNTPRLPNCAVADTANQSQCKTCDPSYTNTLSGCVLFAKFCQAYDQESGLCQACHYNLILQNNTCFDPNCHSQAVNGCTQCVSYFSLNSHGYCSFSDSNCAAADNNRCMSCNSGYFVTILGFCHVLPANCAAANMQSYACIACLPNFRLNGQGGCDLIIQVAIPNCNSINSKGVCLQCSDGYYMSGNLCLPVSPLCAQYSQVSGSCISCKQGWSLVGAACIDPNCASQDGDNCSICSPGYYLGRSLCTIIPVTNCLTADSQGNCLKCQANYRLSRGSCMHNPVPIQNCQSYNLITAACIYCFQGYILRNNICMIAPPKYITLPLQNNTGDKDPNCIKQANDGCIECSQNYYYFSENKTCIAVNPQCKTYNSQAGFCLSCFSGYVLLNGSCIISNNLDPNCKVASNGLCSQCFSGYFYSISYQKCIPLNPLCKTSNTTDGSCLSCYPGYTIVNKDCSIFMDANCKRATPSGDCLQCIKNYYFSSGKCLQVSPFCKTYDLSNGNCLSCYAGYAISGSGCQVSSSLITIDRNCMSFNNSQCTQCYNGHYLNDAYKCIQNNPLCKTINISNGHCTSCYQGYALSSGICQVSSNPTNSSDSNCKSTSNFGVCTSCYQGYYLNVNYFCSPVNTLCKTFTQSQAACTSCYDGYYLSSGNCIIWNPATTINDPYCIKVQNGVCTFCSDGYYLSKNLICLFANPLCKTVDNTGSCTSCYEGYSINYMTCTINPAINIAGCAQGTGSICTTCLSGYYLSNGSCQAVSILCTTYDPTTGACLTCSNGYSLENGVCIYLETAFDPNCVFYSRPYCTQCMTGYRLYNYICVAMDPNCLSFDPSGSVCTSCANNLTPSGLGCA